MFEFHISRQTRQRYRFGETLFSTSGNVVFANIQAARVFTDLVNRTREVHRHPDLALRPGEVNAMGLIDEVLHHVVAVYRRRVNPRAMQDACAMLEERLGRDSVDAALRTFVHLFPPSAVFRGELAEEEYLSGSTAGVSHRAITLEEMLLLFIANRNPAFRPFLEFFDEQNLAGQTHYLELMRTLDTFFQDEPRLMPYDLPLIEPLFATIKAAPHSLQGQLEFIYAHWGELISDLMLRILMGMDVIKEERVRGWGGAGPAPVLRFGLREAEEIERFSPDEDWMPRLVLMAKSVYVWLDQLSRKYGRTIKALDQIPDEELDLLAGWGFTGLWLIGIWERSPASRRIKQRMGNPEALSSAYSVYDYTVAADLGGEGACDNLKARAAYRGIRLATDMVPNHTGIYSRWMIEHPERFIQLGHSPFPAYNFSGPDLSEDPRVGIFIDDGYWERRDAAVVFRRVDRATGQERFIYHGNDGTSMPWNDTAQLDFLKHEVRRAVIDMTVEIAQRFPVIRFDAAMTLTKRHFQRLWYPLPGFGGDIPSRAENTVSQEDFHNAFPEEFWRELVDEVAHRAPNTLLLAEAFWLMEGYFVRSLGMHRVYNSAFMNMLKEEENSKYRDVMKNVLRFNPEILRRFVNFMNNPDEDPAVSQFGKGDKYFGVAAMLVTMPGLPMFGHGQVEGFAEKYGMEYRRAYYQEIPDGWLIERHEREIFPLMRKRYLFSGAANFALFDFVTPDGWVDENVYAYTNRANEERALMVYNNAYQTSRGVLHTSTAINVGGAEDQLLQRRTLVEALALNTDPRYYTILRDIRTGLEYLRHTAPIAEAGLHFELHAYEYKAFASIREVCDHDRSWGRLHALLGDKGVPDMQEAYIEMYLSEVLNPFRALMTSEMVTHLLTTEDVEDILGPWRGKMTVFLKAVCNFTNQSRETDAILAEISAGMKDLRLFMLQPDMETLPKPVRAYLKEGLPPDTASPDEVLRFWRPLALYCLLRPVGRIGQPDGDMESIESQSASWMQSWLLIKHIGRSLETSSENSWQAQRDARLAYACTAQRTKLMALDSSIWGPVLFDLFENTDVHALLQLNLFSSRRWMNKEALEKLLHTLVLASTFDCHLDKDNEESSLVECYTSIRDILDAASDTGYDFDWMLSTLK